MTPELISLILSIVATFALIVYVRGLIKTAGSDRKVDPVAVEELMANIDWSHAYRVLDRKKT
ncbi:hypothetical protein [Ruegeria sp. HKCCSP335]|uniref:hypothetical protein n=1 Tax=Ruegeria sp. HKCCSP335 TaxID=2794833 RepID=UPI001AE217A5|nr:hypothetical protein [Ruegeria sp. HKCCSP335]